MCKDNEKKTLEQTIDYIKCMTITKNVPDEVYRNLGSENYAKVTSYIEAPMTATWFRDSEEKGKKNCNEYSNYCKNYNI